MPSRHDHRFEPVAGSSRIRDRPSCRTRSSSESPSNRGGPLTGRSSLSRYSQTIWPWFRSYFLTVRGSSTRRTESSSIGRGGRSSCSLSVRAVRATGWPSSVRRTRNWLGRSTWRTTRSGTDPELGLISPGGAENDQSMAAGIPVQGDQLVGTAEAEEPPFDQAEPCRLRPDRSGRSSPDSPPSAANGSGCLPFLARIGRG